MMSVPVVLNMYVLRAACPRALPLFPVLLPMLDSTDGRNLLLRRRWSALALARASALEQSASEPSLLLLLEPNARNRAPFQPFFVPVGSCLSSLSTVQSMSVGMVPKLHHRELTSTAALFSRSWAAMPSSPLGLPKLASLCASCASARSHRGQILGPKLLAYAHSVCWQGENHD